MLQGRTGTSNEDNRGKKTTSDLTGFRSSLSGVNQHKTMLQIYTESSTMKQGNLLILKHTKLV